MILTIDIGNTRIKGAVFEHNTLVEYFVFTNNELKININNILKTYNFITNMIVVSVKEINIEEIINLNNNIKVDIISHQQHFPFTNLYATPLTLGLDRMVLAAGAVLMFPNQNRLIIDAGTCITYDFVDCKNIYHGGAISPGFRLRYESLHNYTAKLPLLNLEIPKTFIGNSTNNAIHSGVVNGLVFEIDGFTEKYKSQFSNFIIILTGGDSVFLAKRLKNTIFANSNFLLESLNKIYQYKIKND